MKTMSRVWAFILLIGLSVSNCQCFVPVSDGRQDAGFTDAGRDAGTDAGIVPECTLASDCPGSEMTVQACTRLGTTVGFSCIDRRCVWACAGGRSCLTSNEPRGVCLGCGDARPRCRETCATSSGVTEGIVEQSTCPQGSDFFMLETLKLNEGPNCAWQVVSSSTGVPLGRIETLDTLQFWAELPTLGGVCVGEVLSDDAQRRWVFSCPACQFTVNAR